MPPESLPAPTGREAARGTLRRLVLFLPQFVVLLKRLMTDPRVPLRSKMLFGGTLVYLVSPIDVIPDFVPGLGQLDDVVLAVIALHSILNRVDPAVIREHWDGDGEIIELVRAGVAAATRLIPGKWDTRV